MSRMVRIGEWVGMKSGFRADIARASDLVVRMVSGAVVLLGLMIGVEALVYWYHHPSLSQMEVFLAYRQWIWPPAE